MLKSGKRIMKKMWMFFIFLAIIQASFGKESFIVDTDLREDDWAALSFLMSMPENKILAIVTESTSAHLCRKSLKNLTHILKFWNRTDIPIACNNQKGLYGVKFPSKWFSKINIKLTENNDKPVKIVKNATKLINDELKKIR